MRIGVISNARIVNGWYRAHLPFSALAQRGHDVRWIAASDQLMDVGVLSTCDVVFIHRYFDEVMQRTARELKAAGVALWWDNDDDIAAIERTDPMYRKVGGTRGARIFAGMRRMMELADTVSSPSAVLTRRYERLGLGAGRFRVLENCVADDFGSSARRSRNDSKVVIGWVAAMEHRFDAERLKIRETLARLLHEHPQAEVVTVGVSLGLGDRYRHVTPVPPDELPDHIAQFDVGIAPIADSQMNQARSNIKLKEYAALGVPWLASPIGPYVGLGDKQGGQLVPDDGWDTALDRLVRDARARKKQAKRAAKWGASQRIGRNVGEWEKVLVETAKDAAVVGAR